LHIFLTFFDDAEGDFADTLAYAGACLLGPDYINGRVVAGRVAFNIHHLDKSLEELLAPQ
jgi:hypothetical protein